MISLVPFRSFRGPLFPKPVTGQELFFAVSYSKLALVYPVLVSRFVKTFNFKKNVTPNIAKIPDAR